MQRESLRSLRGISYYDECATVFARSVAGRQPVADAIQLSKELPPGSLVVDAGCGVGQDAAYMARQGLDVYAYDGSPQMVRLATDLLAPIGVDVHCHTHSALKLESPAAGILASASLLFLQEEDLTQALQAFASNLAPQGKLLASFKQGDGVRPQPDGRAYHDRQPEFLHWMAKVSGLRAVETRTHSDVLGRTQTWLTFVLEKR